MKIRFSTLWLCVFFLAPLLMAREKTDVLIMKNGDRITCEIKGLESDTLYISVDYILSTLSLNWAKVDRVESKQLFIVKTQNGTVYSGTLSTPKVEGDRPIHIEVATLAENRVELDKTQIVQMDQTSSSFWQRFNGAIGTGISYNKGNQSTQYNLNSDVTYPRERWSAGAAYTSTLSSSTGASVSSRNQLSLNAQRLLRWNNWYYAGLVDFLQSTEQGIQLQTGLGGGIGRFIANNNHAKISLVGGLMWQRINYQESLLPSPTQNVGSALIGADVNLFRFNKTRLGLTTYLMPALTEPGRVHYTMNATYYVKLWSNLTWNVSFFGNWDNRPPPGFSGSDYGTTSGLSWTFGNQ
jgi:Protein of unknown function, DUF481